MERNKGINMSFEAMRWASEQQAGASINKLLLLLLGNYADQNYECFPSIGKLAKMAEASESTIRRSLRDLEARGLIKINERFQAYGDKHRQTSNTYILQTGCQIDTHQAEQVLKHSLSLYKGLEDSKVDTYDDDDDSLLSNRELLRAGSQLHECGKFISQQRFHHHSFYIISNSRLLGFSQKERLIIGLIARFWRKGTLRLIREDYKFLSARDVDRIQLLSSLIRIAVAGNRTRKGLIDNLYLSKIKSDFYLHIKLKNPKIPIRVDFQKIETEKSVLEKILQKDVHLEVLS